MISQIESDKSPLVIEASHKIFDRLHKARETLTQVTETLQETTQQAKASVTETTGQAVDRVSALTQQTKGYLTTSQNAVDQVAHDTLKTLTVTAQQAKASLQETVEQTKDSVQQTLQTAGQIKSTTSEAIESAITTSTSDWLQANPAVLRLLNFLAWATHHPILSLGILIFTIAIAWSLIKAIGRLFENIWLFILQTPFRLGQFSIRACSQVLGSYSRLITKRFLGKHIEKPALPTSNFELVHQDKQQRLLEISTKLEALRKEQDELLQEAIAILNTEEISSEIFGNLPIHPVVLDDNEHFLRISVSEQENL